MGETQTSTVVEAKKEMDEMIAGVMPETWPGHGRLRMHEYDFDSEENLERANLSVEALCEKYPNTSSEKIAEKVIQKF